MFKFLTFLFINICCSHACEDMCIEVKKESSTPVIKSILKKIESPLSVDESFCVPVIDETILLEFQKESPAAFCDSTLKETPRQQIQDSFLNMTPLPHLSLETSQEFFFYSLKWPMILYPNLFITRNYLETSLSFDSFIGYYQPLGRLLANGFRKNHHSHKYLVDSCLHSLNAFKNFWNNRNHPSKRNKSNRACIPSKISVTSLQKIETIEDLITQLEQLTSHRENHIQKVRFHPHNQEKSIENNKASTYNPGLKNLITFNTKLRNLCGYQFIEIVEDAPTKEELLNEMQMADYFMDYFMSLTSKFPFSLVLPYPAILKTIEYYYPTINFIKDIIGDYPPNKNFDDSLIDAVEIIKNLTPFAVYFLQCIEIPLTTETILLQTIPKLDGLIHMANNRLLKHQILVTYGNQIKELRTLKLLYQFSIKMREKSELKLEVILEDMKLYESIFDEALLNTVSEDPALLEEEIMRLIELSSPNLSETEEESDAIDEELSASPPSASKKRRGDDLLAEFADLLPQAKHPSAGIEIEA